jgi:hypothetical protein
MNPELFQCMINLSNEMGGIRSKDHIDTSPKERAAAQAAKYK